MPGSPCPALHTLVLVACSRTCCNELGGAHLALIMIAHQHWCPHMSQPCIRPPCNFVFHSLIVHLPPIPILISYPLSFQLALLLECAFVAWTRREGIAIKQHKGCEGRMAMSATWAEQQATLQQLGVTQDQVIFYYSGKTRGRCVSL